MPRGGGRSRRIIPARAGFTCWAMNGAPARRDHPRSRGVYPGIGSTLTPAPGSSPLARGLPCCSGTRRCEHGIIPARAGFTLGRSRGLTRTMDHPRSRGVYVKLAALSPDDVGSSPLARGLHGADALVGSNIGIIPARAGFTIEETGEYTTMPDHPRSRGVYRAPGCGEPPRLGSSPLARGLRDGEGRDHRRGRIIPARAGFTTPPTNSRIRWGDHPRSRGVYRLQVGLKKRLEGSSPLARGLRFGKPRETVANRIIPARAGFTPQNTRYLLGSSDHPRSRGVY